MKANRTKRARHAYQPSVDSLEGRIVLSPGGVALAAAAQQQQEQRQHRIEVRHERQQHRIEVRHEHQLALQARRHTRRHHAGRRFVFATQSAVGTANAIAGNSTSSNAAGTSVINSTANRQNLPRHSVINVAPRRNRAALALTVGSAAANLRTPVATNNTNGATTLNSTLANLLAANLLSSGNIANSNLLTTTGNVFSNIPTGAGTVFTSPGALNNGSSVLFTNLPTAAGTSAITGLNNGTGTVLTNGAFGSPLGSLVGNNGLGTGTLLTNNPFGSLVGTNGLGTGNVFTNLPTAAGTSAITGLNNGTGIVFTNGAFGSPLGTLVGTNGLGAGSLLTNGAFGSPLGTLVGTNGLGTGTLGQVVNTFSGSTFNTNTPFVNTLI